MTVPGCFTGNGASVTITLLDSPTGPESAAATLFNATKKASLGEVAMEVEVLESPQLSKPKGSFRTLCVGDDITTGPWDVTMYFEPDLDVSKLIGRRATIRRTHQTHAGKTTAAFWEGTGFIVKVPIPEEAPSQLAQGTAQLIWQGDDLVHTPSAA